MQSRIELHMDHRTETGVGSDILAVHDQSE